MESRNKLSHVYTASLGPTNDSGSDTGQKVAPERPIPRWDISMQNSQKCWGPCFPAQGSVYPFTENSPLTDTPYTTHSGSMKSRWEDSSNWSFNDIWAPCKPPTPTEVYWMESDDGDGWGCFKSRARINSRREGETSPPHVPRIPFDPLPGWKIDSSPSVHRANYFDDAIQVTRHSLQPPVTTPQIRLERLGIIEYLTQLREIATTYNYEQKTIVYILSDGAWETSGDGTVLRFFPDFWKSPRRYTWPADVEIKIVFERDDRYVESRLKKLGQSLP